MVEPKIFDSVSYVAGALSATAPTDKDFFATPGKEFLLSLLHAAAAQDSTTTQVESWLENPADNTPLAALEELDEWHQVAQQVYNSTPLTQESIFTQARKQLDALVDA